MHVPHRIQIVNTTHRRTNSLVLNSKSDPVAVSYTLTYPTILLQIDLASNANTPPPSSTVWYLVNLGPCEPKPCSCTLAKEEQKYIPCQPDS